LYYRALECTFLGLDQLIVNFTVKVKENFQQVIVFSCEPQWQQEDITVIAKIITEQHAGLSVKEANRGLDRESYLVTDGNADYWLHFEYYSQSIWIESLSEHTVHHIESLFKTLIKTQNADG